MLSPVQSMSPRSQGGSPVQRVGPANSQGGSKGVGQGINPTPSATQSGKSTPNQPQAPRAKTTPTKRKKKGPRKQSPDDDKERDPVHLAFFEWMAKDQALWVDLKKFARKQGESVASASSPGKNELQRPLSATAPGKIQAASRSLQAIKGMSKLPSKTRKKKDLGDMGISESLSSLLSKSTLKSDSSYRSLAKSGSSRSVTIGGSEFKFLQGSAANRTVRPQGAKPPMFAASSPSASTEEVLVLRLMKTEGSVLGLDVIPNFKAASLLVKNVKTGLVDDWNRNNPSNRVNVGDEVFEVNGFQGDARALASQCVMSGWQLEMKLYRKGEELKEQAVAPGCSDRQSQIAKGLSEAAMVTTASDPLVAAGLKAAASNLEKASLETAERKRQVANALSEAAAVTTASDPSVTAGLKAAAAAIEGRLPRTEWTLTSDVRDIDTWTTSPESTTASLASMLGSSSSTLNMQFGSTAASTSSLNPEALGLNNTPGIFFMVYSTRLVGKLQASFDTSDRRRQLANALSEAALVTTAGDPSVAAGLRAAAAAVEKDLSEAKGTGRKASRAKLKAKGKSLSRADMKGLFVRASRDGSLERGLKMAKQEPSSEAGASPSMSNRRRHIANALLEAAAVTTSRNPMVAAGLKSAAATMTAINPRVAAGLQAAAAKTTASNPLVAAGLKAAAAMLKNEAGAPKRAAQAQLDETYKQVGNSGAVEKKASQQMQRQPPLAKPDLGYICHNWMPTGDTKPMCCLWECRDEAAAKSIQNFIDGPDGLGKDSLVNDCYRIVPAGNFRAMTSGMLPQSRFAANDLSGQVDRSSGCFFWVLHRFRSDTAIPATSWWENMNKILTSPPDLQRFVERHHELGFHNHNFLATGVDGPIFCIWECQTDLSQAGFQKFVDGPDGLGPGVFASEAHKVAAGAVLPSAYFKVGAPGKQDTAAKIALEKGVAKQALKIGLRVRLAGQGGTIRFLGPTLFTGGVWVGVELDRPLGKNNGSVNNVNYFSCKPKHGIFVREEVVSLEGVGQEGANDQGLWGSSMPPPLVPFMVTASWTDQKLAEAWSTCPIEGWRKQDPCLSPRERVPKERSEDWGNVSICVRRDVIGNHSRERFTERPAEGELLRLRYKCLSALGKGNFTTAFLAEDAGATGAGKFSANSKNQRKLMVCLKKHHNLSFEALADLMAIGKRVENVDSQSKYFPRFLDAFYDMACFTVETLVDGTNCLAIAKADPCFFADLGNLRVVARDCLNGLALLAEAKVVHNDMKPDNFMWVQGSSRKGSVQWPSVKIVDFGCSRLDQQEEPGRNWALSEGGAGHVGKWSPEMALRLPISPVADVWGLSVSLCELHTGRAMWRDERDTWEIVLAQSLGLCGLADGLPTELLRRSPMDIRIMFTPSPRHLPVRRNASGMLEVLEPSSVGLNQVVGDEWRNNADTQDFRAFLLATLIADPVDRPPAAEVLETCAFVQEPREEE